MIPKLLKGLSAQKQAAQRAELYRNLIRQEAKIGGTLFGPVPQGHRREFFCLDERTWIWHEEWIEDGGQRKSKTTRYDVRPDAILKAQDGQDYKLVGSDEARNLYQAVVLYQQRVNIELYHFS